jgi:hypothetical protein
MGDLEMLESARFALLVDHDDAEREHRYSDDAALAASRTHGWTTVSMRRDVRTLFADADADAGVAIRTVPGSEGGRDSDPCPMDHASAAGQARSPEPFAITGARVSADLHAWQTRRSTASRFGFGQCGHTVGIREPDRRSCPPRHR